MDRELGAPSFNAHLVRSRAGPSGLHFNLQWDIHSHAFRDRQSGCDATMDGVVAPAFADGPADAGERDAA